MLEQLGNISVNGGEAGIITILLGRYLYESMRKRQDTTPTEKAADRLEKHIDKLVEVTSDHKILMDKLKTVMETQTQVLQALVTKITNS